MIKEVINLANDLSVKYDNDIYQLIDNYDCRILFKKLKDKIAYTIKIDNVNYIVINSDIDEENLDFILAHEFYHTLKHSSAIRQFSKLPLSTNKYELEANLFATIFLKYQYHDCNNDNFIQKIINNICCNYSVCDFSILK